MMVLLGYLLIAAIAVISSAATAYSQVSLDDQIQRLREGKKITISEADFLKARTDPYDKFLEFAAELYIEQIRWSLISPKKHGGWPVRSFVVEEPDWIADIYRNLKKKAERTDDSLVVMPSFAPPCIWWMSQKFSDSWPGWNRKTSFSISKRMKLGPMVEG